MITSTSRMAPPTTAALHSGGATPAARPSIASPAAISTGFHATSDLGDARLRAMGYTLLGAADSQFLAEPVDGLTESFFERHPRLPPEHRAGTADIRPAPGRVVLAFGHELDLG